MSGLDPARALLVSVVVDTSSSQSPDLDREISELCFCGDWACADGNLEVLRYIACRVATYADEPLNYQLLVLAEMCREAPEHAITVWLQLKDRVLGRSATGFGVAPWS